MGKITEELQKMAQLFDMNTDQIINHDGSIPKEVILEDKTELEQIRLIPQLEEEDKQTIFRLVEKMLTNKKCKDFFAKKRSRFIKHKTHRNCGGLFLSTQSHRLCVAGSYILLLRYIKSAKIITHINSSLCKIFNISVIYLKLSLFKIIIVKV
ncbi:hypothetical protein [Chryseobacterium elymi]|uniref:hypothetical protein n=1 Tax=Chryseobacterium elymi TaxID=395936 RepID=UPI001624F51C|nr:hypothetical protein [Chryseobacterium elymi]